MWQAVAAKAGSDLAAGGVQAYLKWKEMQDQKARQALMDRQTAGENAMNLAEYQAGNPIGSAQMDANMKRMNYLKFLASMGK